MNETIEKNKKVDQVILPAELLEQWQGHRKLTRKVIEAFPESEFFTHSIGGMRTFAEMTVELLQMAGPGLAEIAIGENAPVAEKPNSDMSKSQLLELWDGTTNDLNTYWDRIPVERFHDYIKLFGRYEGTVLSSILYFIDNEIHHRGQGYVYLRSLGIEPPAFWERN